MKFLVLAFFLGAANAASIFNSSPGAYKPWSFSTTAATPVVPVYYPSTTVEPVKPVVLAKTVYNGVESNANILSSDSEVNADSYQFKYDTENGISAQSNGVLKTVGDVAALVMQGFYEYTAPDGTPVRVTYTADENGFRAESDVLPVAPPVPEEIRQAVKYILENTPAKKTVE